MFGKVGGQDRESEPELDLGSQLEELVIHVLKCERWANLDDRINLSLQTWRQRSDRRSQDGPLGLGRQGTGES